MIATWRPLISPLDDYAAVGRTRFGCGRPTTDHRCRQTIANLDGRERVETSHVREAIKDRMMGRRVTRSCRSDQTNEYIIAIKCCR
jgi:hypothetical protein